MKTFKALLSLLSLLTLMALPSASFAQSNSGSQNDVQPPAWFASLPQYDLKPLTVDDSMVQLLGLDPQAVYVKAGLTGDSLTTVVDFYTSKLAGMGWPDPKKSNLISDSVAQTLSYQNGKLTILIASKQAFGMLPQTKALNAQIPDGQTFVALITPVDKPPMAGTRCQPGTECQVGPYKVKVSLSRTDFNTTDGFTATVERLDQTTGDWQLKAAAVPSSSTSATEVDFSGSFTSGNATTRPVDMNFPISGNWYIYLTITTAESGSATLYIPEQAAPPPVMDPKLAWAIGLAPVVGFVGFGFGQWRFVRRKLKGEKTLPPVAPEVEVPEPVNV